MGLFLRKSFSAGPVRFNISKSGLGMSTGVKGLRIGTGPRGAYIAGGRGAVRFRQSLTGSASRSSASRSKTVPTAQSTAPNSLLKRVQQIKTGEAPPNSPGLGLPVFGLVIGLLFLTSSASAALAVFGLSALT